MAFSLITSVTGGTNSNGATTSSVNTTGADLIIVSVGWYGNGAAPSISDSKSNSYTGLTAKSNISIGNRLFYVENPTVGSGHTFTVSAASGYPSICVLAFSGKNASAAFDQQNGAIGSATSIQPGSVTPTIGNELVVCGLGHENNSGATPTINGGFTAITKGYSGGAYEGSGLAYLIQTTATAANPTWSITNSAALASTIATFKSSVTFVPNPYYYLHHVAGRV